MTTGTPPPDAVLTVLLVDDLESQSTRIQRCLRPYRVWVEWRPSYRAAVELLQDPDLGQLVDLILIDQAFDVDAVAPSDLLTPSEVGALSGTQGWDPRLHQGLFILARLTQDMREGAIPFTPMMILTDYGKVELAAQALGMGGYQSKRRLITDPYAAIREWLPHMRPREEDVDRRLSQVAAALGLEDELASQVREKVLAGLDLDEVSSTLHGLGNPNDWTAVGHALDRLAEQHRSFPADRLAMAVEGAWLSSPAGWLRVGDVESVGSLDHEFEAFRVQMSGQAGAFRALLAATAIPSQLAPGVRQLRQSFRLLRAIDERSHPVRLVRGSWTILGSWLREPEPLGAGARAAARRLIGVTGHVRALHERGLAHGALSAMTTGFEPPVFGGIRCLVGAQDLAELRRDDMRRLPALATAAFGEEPPDGARPALDRWSGMIAAGDLDGAQRALETARLHERPPAYFNFDHVVSPGEGEFRDLLLATLGAEDAVLREVRCDEVSSVPFDFVVCAGGAVAVLEHRVRLRRVVMAGGGIASVESTVAEAEDGRWQRSLARCRRAARALAERIESALGLPVNSIEQLPAIVVPDRAAIEASATTAWRSVVTETEAIAELTRLSRRPGRPSGRDMADILALPAAPAPSQARSRGLHWAAIPIGPETLRMRTWRKQWPPESWTALLRSLAVARDLLQCLPGRLRPFPLAGLRAYDDEAGLRDVEMEAAMVEWVEYDVGIPSGAAPLASYFWDQGSDAGRRSMAAELLRSLLFWERSELAYRTMGPDGVLHAGGRVHFDLLSSVGRLDAESQRRQRRGAAACLVFLLAPWPYAWPAVLSGTTPVMQDQVDERSAWGIAASAVAALLDPQRPTDELTNELHERAELLAAAARLDRRFPSWPAGLAQEIRS